MGLSLSNYANDQPEVGPTLASVASELGKVQAAALDTGYFSEANLDVLEAKFPGITKDEIEEALEHIKAVIERLHANLRAAGFNVVTTGNTFSIRPIPR